MGSLNSELAAGRKSLRHRATMLRYAVVLLLAVVGVSHALSDAEKAVKPKSECDKEAYDCLSFPNSFKCSMAFKKDVRLSDDERKKKGKATGNPPINILDIIPDLINQPGVTLTKEITDELELREINFPAFDIADVCSNKIKARKRANARCYAFLQDYAEEPLDSCETGLVTSDGEEVNEGTVGDALCEKAFNLNFTDEAARRAMDDVDWAVSKWDGSQSDSITIGAYFSYCGTKWQEVATGTGKSRKPLELKRPLCCYKPANPVCVDGKITGNAEELPEKRRIPQWCKIRPLTLGCPCPQLPLKPKYGRCIADPDRHPRLNYRLDNGKGKGCEEKK